ncbi:MAG: hypothetical protein GY874_03185 [Desulfobacteraceae bacterium]|nr:hypothetical protein [Desulfobacteraceae bacterium]
MVITILKIPAYFITSDSQRIPIESKWRNDGMAPTNGSYVVEWTLHNSEGEIAASAQVLPAIPTAQWTPGEDIELSSVLEVPAGLPEGAYTIKVALVSPESGEYIMLGLAGRDSEKRYKLCTINGSDKAFISKAGSIYEEAFESGYGQ